MGGGSLKVELNAIPDEKTPIALTFHPYFNLNAFGAIDNHSLYINASKITKVDSEMVANGDIILTTNTPYDFSENKVIGSYPYDINYLLNGNFAAKAISNESGVVMEIYTNQKGLQFYTANELNTKSGKTGAYSPRAGFCLEPQNYANDVNIKSFPSPFVENGESYIWQAEYKFKTI